jgi:hypothetical protein
LPIPVEPATNKCGIFAKFATTGWPLISLPSPMVSMEGDWLNSLEDKISLQVCWLECNDFKRAV